MEEKRDADDAYLSELRLVDPIAMRAKLVTTDPEEDPRVKHLASTLAEALLAAADSALHAEDS